MVVWGRRRQSACGRSSPSPPDNRDVLVPKVCDWLRGLAWPWLGLAWLWLGFGFVCTTTCFCFIVSTARPPHTLKPLARNDTAHRATTRHDTHHARARQVTSGHAISCHINACRNHVHGAVSASSNSTQSSSQDLAASSRRMISRSTSPGSPVHHQCTSTCHAMSCQ